MDEPEPVSPDDEDLAHDEAFWGRVAESAKLPSEPLPPDLL